MAWYWILFIALGIGFSVLCVGYFLLWCISSVLQAIEEKEKMQKDIEKLIKCTDYLKSKLGDLEVKFKNSEKCSEKGGK